MTPAHSNLKTKDSGIEWVGSIPYHWKVLPFYSFAAEVSHPNTGLKERNLLSLSYGHIVRRDMDRLAGLTPASFEGYNIIEEDDIVFRLTDLQNDQTSLRSARATERGIITSAYVTVRPHSSPRFFDYLMRSYDTTKVFYGTGGGIRQSMKYADLKRLPVVVPPVDEMEAIASFLDRATRRINALIAKKTRFIELLWEKRKALITQAVTRGLDAGVPMKDSGIEWLGMIPASWLTKRLRFACDVTTGYRDTIDATPDGEFPFYVRSQDVGRIDTYSADCEAVLTAGDGAGVGKVYHYVNGKFDFHQRVYMMYNFRSVRGKFFFYYLSSLFAAVALDGGAKSTVDSLRMPVFKNFSITVPSLAEQDKIVNFIEEHVLRIDALIAKTERSIELLREHRIALISAAVTGKIDLREAT